MKVDEPLIGEDIFNRKSRKFNIKFTKILDKSRR